jgi:hypothetical protein
MRIGNLAGEIPQTILDLGFNFPNKIKLLGFTLQNYGDIIACNFEHVTERIDNLTRFWERFFLSLPGKIAIYKTLLIPQINYIATIFMPNAEKITELENKMEKFVLGNLVISKAKLYRSVDQGGLGLFPLFSFIQSLQCSWVKRCRKSINDNWRYRIASLSNGNLVNVVNDDYTINRVGSVLKEIIHSFVKLKGMFTQRDNNYMAVPFYCNPASGLGRGLRNR